MMVQKRMLRNRDIRYDYSMTEVKKKTEKKERKGKIDNLLEAC